MSERKNTESFIEEARKIHGNKYDYSKVNYINSYTKVCIICPEHGEFYQRPSDHIKGRGCPICKKYKKLSLRVGDVFESEKYGKYEVIKISNNARSYIRFINTGSIRIAWNNKIKTLKVRDYMYPDVLGVGYLGFDFDEKIVNTKSYRKWYKMLERCYNYNYLIKEPSYIGCFVCEEWKSYYNFKKWFDENYIDGCELDKDILFKGNKIYSPNTCCFVPKNINNLLTKSNSSRGRFPIGVSFDNSTDRFKAIICKNGKNVTLGRYNTPEEAFLVYKQAKEAWIKEVANKWKDKLADNAYEALMNYQVEITD